MMACLIAANTTVVAAACVGEGLGGEKPTPLPINRACVQVAPFTGPTSAVTWQVDGAKRPGPVIGDPARYGHPQSRGGSSS
jgi:hypothetical protein